MEGRQFKRAGQTSRERKTIAALQREGPIKAGETHSFSFNAKTENKKKGHERNRDLEEKKSMKKRKSFTVLGLSSGE